MTKVLSFLNSKHTFSNNFKVLTTLKQIKMINKKHLVLYFIILATFTMKAQKGSYMELSPDLNLFDSYKSKIDGIELIHIIKNCL